jgi:hypothetical protein
MGGQVDKFRMPCVSRRARSQVEDSRRVESVRFVDRSGGDVGRHDGLFSYRF